MNLKLSKFAQGDNCHLLQIGPLSIWFSYSTPIAYQVQGGDIVMRKNEWGPTTGRHMGAIGVPPNQRVPGDQFVDMLGIVLFGKLVPM